MIRVVFLAVMVLALDMRAPVHATDMSLISEIRLGLYRHDAGVFSDRKEEAELAASGVVLFKRPGWRFQNPLINWVFTPRPHLGAIVALEEGTSLGYFGATWDYRFFDRFFAEFGFGGAIHNGNTDTPEPKHKALGTRVLFHEHIVLGVEVTETIRVMAALHHVSNAGIADRNGGMDFAGVLVGLKF